MSSTPPRKKPEELRSQQWFGRQDRDGFAYRSWLKGKGIPQDQFEAVNQLEMVVPVQVLDEFTVTDAVVLSADAQTPLVTTAL